MRTRRTRTIPRVACSRLDTKVTRGTLGFRGGRARNEGGVNLGCFLDGRASWLQTTAMKTPLSLTVSSLFVMAIAAVACTTAQVETPETSTAAVNAGFAIKECRQGDNTIYLTRCQVLITLDGQIAEASALLAQRLG